MVRGMEMHLKLHLALGACSRAKIAWGHTTEQSEGLKKFPKKCYGSFEEAEINFVSGKQSRLCGRSGGMFLHALFIKHF